MVGKILGGRYEVLERIGTGGMSLVYRARDLTLNRIVAVKTLKRQWAEDEDVVRRFDQEARAAASVTNRHVVQVFDVGQEDPDVHYIVMELVSGETLRTKLDRDHTLSVRDALQIAVQVADALEAAHRQKLVHRDIKPQNILIAEDGTVKVTDFGIAYAATTGTLVNTRSFLGTVQYLSPEQARGKLVGTQSDLYSLGVVLFEMLTGKLPFESESAIGVALKHMQDEAPDVRSIRPTIPEPVSRMVARALSKDPAERYQTASAFKLDMMRFLDPEADLPPVQPAADPPAAVPSRSELPSRAKSKDEQKKRHPARAWTIAGVIAALVVAAAVFAFYHWLRTPPVAVPDVRGMRLVAAENRLGREGLKAKLVGHSSSAKIAPGRVLTETPPPRSTVKRGQVVALVVSAGPAQVTLPNLRGDSVAAAVQNLNSLDLRHRVERVHSGLPARVVTRQSPAAHSRIAHGGTVTLWVSEGPRHAVTMPDVVGMTMSEAATLLNRDNLTAATPLRTYSTDPANTIVDQSPEPYASVRGVRQVSLWMSDGPSPASRHLSFNQTTESFAIAASAPHNSLFRAVVTDQAGNKEVYYRVVEPGKTVTVNAAWYGTAGQIATYLNGKHEVTRTLSHPPLPPPQSPGQNNVPGGVQNGISNIFGNVF